MASTKRLYIMTGKGGVGKTTTSLALTQYLREQGRDAVYLTFGSNSFSELSFSDSDKKLAEKLGIANQQFKLLPSTQKYIAKKLKSETLAKWVIKTPFFKALLNMTPGFSYLIYLGTLLDSLRDSPNKVYILDSPSSGHLLTMLESVQNTMEIFKSGLLFEDASKIIGLLESENFTQINIFGLPTTLATTEAIELEEAIKDITPIKTRIYCNNCLGQIPSIANSTLPEVLNKKIEIEMSIMAQHKEVIRAFFPHMLSNDEVQVVKQLTPLMSELIND